MLSRLKSKLQARDVVFGSWVSFSHPSITEIFVDQDFDFHAIDMEHTTISLEQAQRIIAASQASGIPCLPRPDSFDSSAIKPLLDSGADGLIVPLIQNETECNFTSNQIKFPPLGTRSFGVNRAHGYGRIFDNYLRTWNENSVYIAQIETKQGVMNIDSILQNENLDGVMIGPYDLSGSLGVPGKLNHPSLIEAERLTIEACQKYGKACGTQVANFSAESVEVSLSKGYTFIVASSDLFILSSWAESAGQLIREYR
jgi:2-dehydro-3-deoxyglucarate aldolase